MGEFRVCKEVLSRHSVCIMKDVDATNIQLDVERVHGVIWIMAFPQHAAERSNSSNIRLQMQKDVEGFVKSAAGHLDTKWGRVSVIFMAMQHLAWKLPAEIITAHGTFLREVFWFDIEPLFRHGYQPRFGDSRDATRDPAYHTNDEVVIAQWRHKCGPNDLPAGMTDQRVRSVSASSRSRSASRGRKANRR